MDAERLTGYTELIERNWTPEQARVVMLALYPLDDRTPPATGRFSQEAAALAHQFGTHSPLTGDPLVTAERATAVLRALRQAALNAGEPFYGTRYDAFLGMTSPVSPASPVADHGSFIKTYAGTGRETPPPATGPQLVEDSPKQNSLMAWGLISAAGMAIGCIGPWATALGVSASGLDGSNDGWAVIVLALAAVVSLLRATTNRGAGPTALIAGLLSAAVTFYDIYRVNDIASKGGTFAQALIHVGWGLNLALISSVSLAICGRALIGGRLITYRRTVIALVVIIAVSLFILLLVAAKHYSG